MTTDSDRKIIVLTAPSGAGKTTIAHRLMEAFPTMRFAVSATTRRPRPHEQPGVDYHFHSEDSFRRLIAEGALIEYEEVYPGRFYGTLRSDIEKGTRAAPILLDIDVKGALTIERLFGDEALTIFVRPPSLDVLAARLRERGTETEDSLEVRLKRARMEVALADRFDAVVVNDDLEAAVAETLKIVRSFLDA